MSAHISNGRLREYAITPTSPLRVDAEKGILYDVLVLGHSSRNRVDYPREAMQEALSRYDGVPVYVGHTRDGSNPEYDRKLGVIRNPRLGEDGIHGDLHFPPKHRLAEQLLWDAINAPYSCGLSHDADCTWTVQNGRKIVRKIDKVYSVDLVSRPATTCGLVEEEEPAIATELLCAEILRPAPAPDVKTREWESPWCRELRRAEEAAARTTTNHFLGGKQ